MRLAQEAQEAPPEVEASPAGESEVIRLLPRLSVIVPATNEPPTLAAAVDAIEVSLTSHDELIVIREPANCGPAQARNIGAAQARGDVLVFVDADVVIYPQALQLVRERFADDPALSGLFGAYDDLPAAPGVVSNFRNLLHHHVHSSSAGEAQTFWAGLGAIRRHVFHEVGGFGGYTRPSVEDIELGLRLTDAGARIELDPEVRGRHLKRWTFSTMVWTDFRHRGIPWTRLLIERRSIPAVLNLGWRHRASGALSVLGVCALLARRPVATVAALGGMVALNRGLYSLLLRRRGKREAALGIPLHVIHHLTALASIPAGAAVHLRRSRARPEDPRVAHKPNSGQCHTAPPPPQDAWATANTAN